MLNIILGIVVIILCIQMIQNKFKFTMFEGFKDIKESSIQSTNLNFAFLSTESLKSLRRHWTQACRSYNQKGVWS